MEDDSTSRSSDHITVVGVSKHSVLRVGIVAIVAAPAAVASGLSDSDAVLVTPLSMLIGVAIGLAMSAFMSAAEVALFSIPPARLRAMHAEGGFAARLVAAAMVRPGRLLADILIAKTAANVAFCLLAPLLVHRILSAGYTWPPLSTYPAAGAAALFGIVVLGDVLPRVAAARRSESFALAAIVPINILSLALAPFRWTIHNLLVAAFSAAKQPDLQPAPFVLDGEFEAVFERVHPRSVIELDEGEMIRGVLSYGEVMLREILVPRPDIIGLSEDLPARDAIEFYRVNEYSRMPLYRENLDQVTGVLYAKDLLPLAARNELDKPVKSIARKPYYVPATMTVDQFIKECQQLRTHLAIVVDEFGGTEGIVTLEDAMEVVVGDIEDEGDDAPPTYEELGGRAYRIDGAMDLEQVGQLLGVPIEDGEHETLGGFVMAGVGKIPEAGDSIKHNGVVFTIERVEGKRIASIRARIQQLPEELAAS